MNCDCIKRMNAHLAQHNTRICMTPVFRECDVLAVPAIMTEKIDKANRKKPMVAIAGFCPFCGVSVNAPKPQAVQS